MLKLGADQDLRTVAEREKGNISKYELLNKIKQKTDKDKQKLGKLMEQIIATDPERAFGLNTSWENSDDFYHTCRQVTRDKERMLEIGKSLLKKGQHMSALNAFQLAGHTGEHYIQTGLEILQQKEIPWLGNSSERETAMRDRALRAAAIPFFEKGGDPERANIYIPENVEDDLNRKLGYALAKLPPEEHGWNAANAYIRLQLIGKKTEEDNEQIEKLRRRVIEERKEYAGNTFLHAFDKTGLKQFIDQNIDTHPKATYEAAAAQGSPEDVLRARESLVQKAFDGKIRIDRVYEIFRAAGDEEGVKYLDSKIAPGVPQEIAAKLLAK
ncbi:Uncharacterised protein [uncultured archaeon]|nr:Uncharacterised protein [uncultured archaeon]